MSHSAQFIEGRKLDDPVYESNIAGFTDGEEHALAELQEAAVELGQEVVLKVIFERAGYTWPSPA